MKKNIAIILSLGLIISFTVFGIFFYNTRKNIKTIKVVGMAKKEFNADLLKWDLTLSKRT
ncbi:MAG: SIMPL domain-containing protein, partial [Candidatus Mcinerneyibacterium aminivorans]